MNIAIIDIETTGFSHTKNFIVEIGIVELNLLTGTTKIVFDSLVKEVGITKDDLESSWIVENGYIKTDDVLKAPSFDTLKEKIQYVINSYPNGATAYNNKFDFGFLESRDIKISFKLDCPMILATDICKLPNKNGYSNYKFPKVEEAYKYLFPDSEYIELHRGADDAMHEAKIVHELYNMGVFKV